MTKILLIEDNQENLELMMYLLNYKGYETLTTMNGEEAINLVKQGKPDLIICDILLPKLNGYEIAKILKNDSQLKNIPLVAVTAYAMVGDRNKIRAAGFDAYIAKPIDPAQFIIQIESLLTADLRSNKQLNLQSNQTTQPKKSYIENHPIALVVSDYLGTRELCKHILERIEFEVIAVESVEEALKIIEKKIPDLILSDVHLSGLSGLDFLKRIRENARYQSIPFIMMGATPLTEKEKKEIASLKPNRFISLPIDSNAFLKIINDIYSKIKKDTYINR